MATHLKRSLNCPLLIFYGVGTILGAGIYALIGKVASYADLYTPIAFLVSAIIAAFTAITYAELSANFPQSAGEAVYVFEAFKKSWLATCIGLLVILTGIVSSATLTKSFVGYLGVFFAVPHLLGIALTCAIVAMIAIWGILPSVRIISLVTIIEIGGLIFVIASAMYFHPSIHAVHVIPASSDAALGIILGSFVAFYAFIGFEDMVNVAEEVKNPRRNLPIAIFSALLISTLLYMLVSSVAIKTVAVDVLSHSKAPMTLLVDQSSDSAKYLITLISLIAISNGALVQVVMASRVLYGLAKRFNFINLFAKLHPKTQTPILATMMVAVLIFIFAVSLPLVHLAQFTSFVILIIFALMHISLIKLKLQQQVAIDLAYPLLAPVIGLILILLFIGINIFYVI